MEFLAIQVNVKSTPIREGQLRLLSTDCEDTYTVAVKKKFTGNPSTQKHIFSLCKEQIYL